MDSGSTLPDEELVVGTISSNGAGGVALGVDPGDDERQLQSDLLLEMEHEAAEEYERIQEEEALCDAQRWESYVKSREDKGSESEASTVRLTSRKWEEVAMADQVTWQRNKRLRPPGNDDLVSSAASSTVSSEPGVALGPAPPV